MRTGSALPPARASRARAVLLRTALAAAGWLVLTGGALYGLPLAAATVTAAVATSLWLLPPGAWPLRPIAVLRFLPFFLWQSARGGIDVAWRALHPSLPVRPGYATIPLRLPEGPARCFYVAALGLLPGTVSTEVAADAVRVHVLDTKHPVAATLRRLEVHVAEIFGVETADGE